MPCAVCGSPDDHGATVRVCGPCHRALSAPASARSTLEFDAVSPAEVSAALGVAALPASPDTCAWCNKGAGAVRKLLGRGGVALCNECIALCCEILDAELGTWR